MQENGEIFSIFSPQLTHKLEMQAGKIFAGGRLLTFTACASPNFARRVLTGKGFCSAKQLNSKGLVLSTSR